MAESKTLEGIAWLTSRPGLLPLLQHVAVRQGVFACTFDGTEQELIAAGVATIELFQSVGKSQTKVGTDEFGDQLYLNRRRGNWHLTRRLSEDGHYACPTDENQLATRWGKKHAPALEAATASILGRFAKPRC
jgi:hypothetical protein